MEPLADSALSEVARSLSRLGARRFENELEPIPITPRAAGPVAAIDGSSAQVVRGAGVTVGLARAAVILVEGGQVSRMPGDLRLEVFEDGDAARTVSKLAEVLGLPVVAGFGERGSLDAYRELLEYSAVKGWVERLPAGGLVLFDGSFDEPVVGEKGLEELFEMAKRRNVGVAAVSKSTRLRIGGVSALSAAWLAGQRRLSTGAWRVSVPRDTESAYVTFVAKLHGLSQVAFRLDLPGDDPAAVLGHLAALSADPAYLGYPYALALAHNTALITEELVEDVRHRLRDWTIGSGLDESQWALLFEDYHDVLELGA